MSDNGLNESIEFEAASAEPELALALISTPEHVLSLQRAIGNHAVAAFLGSRFGHSTNGAARGGMAANRRAAADSETLPEYQDGPSQARLPLNGRLNGVDARFDLKPRPARVLIVDDDAVSLKAGQMRKRDFLAALRQRVAATADSALADTIWSSVGCPWIEQWFDYYENQDSRHVERAIRRYAPETAQAASARDYIPLVCARVWTALRNSAMVDDLGDRPPESCGSGFSPGLVARIAERPARLLAAPSEWLGRVRGCFRGIFLKMMRRNARTTRVPWKRGDR